MRTITFHRYATLPRTLLLPVLLCVLVMAQLFGFYELCAAQVRVAKDRAETLQLQRTALANCLRDLPSATPAGCFQHVNVLNREAIVSPVRD